MAPTPDPSEPTPSEPTQKTRLARRLLLALLAPIALLVAMGSILAMQLLRMSNDAQWVDRSDEILARANAVQVEILDQQTGLRGYQLTGDNRFLDPYEQARPLQAIDALASVVRDPAAGARVEEIRRLYEAWDHEMSSLSRAHDAGEPPSYDRLAQGKRRMDDVRAALASFMDAERQIRAERAAASSASTTLTRNAFVALFAATALALAYVSRRQLAGVARSYGAMLDRERSTREQVEDEVWIRAGQTRLSEQLQGDASLRDLADRLLRTLAPLVGADVAALFTLEGGGWRRQAGYGLDARCAGPDSFAPGEGLVGRAAAERALVRVTDVPGHFMQVRSGVGESTPVELLLVPAAADAVSNAVIELGFLRPPTLRTRELLARVGDSVGIAVRSAEYRARLRELLEEAQRQSEELQAQQEELRAANEEQRTINQQLEQQSEELRAAQQRIAEKAAEVARASKYKSEFLANMSHELRTPLNSTLILAKLLADNEQGNLTDEQVRFAHTIHAAGNDLLALINDVLDLSKVEAGKLEIRPGTVPLTRVTSALSRMFEPMARGKGLSFSVEIDAGTPAAIETDALRLEQILKNLLSNAIKFTERGGVTLRVGGDDGAITFAVRDTGIGIAEGERGAIFEAFHQGDGASNRKYGGTGLGLSISRNLAELLGGRLEVESEPGAGSTFRLVLPAVTPVDASVRHAPAAAAARSNGAPTSARANGSPRLAPAVTEDDREHLDRSRPVVLVVEDDVAFACIVRDLARELGFHCLVAHDAESGTALAEEYAPNAVVLDVMLPDHSGLLVLDRLKRKPETRHVPVHVVSMVDQSRDALAMGAVGYLLKPVTREALAGAFGKLEEQLARKVRHLLVVEDDQVQRESLGKLLSGDGIEVHGVATVEAALAAMQQTTFDCVVTDLMLPGASGFDLLERMAREEACGFPPVIVYTGRSLSPDEEHRLRRHSSSIIVKGARSPERLLDEVTLFLHQVESQLPGERRRMLQRARDRDEMLDGRRILVVEDDVRNIFALSRVLEPRGAEVAIARNGREALDVLGRKEPVDMVLMDIMMPEMDGLEAIREIRNRPSWSGLPIIALTAKAMKDDQQRCREAGANDYIAKPLDVDMLLSLVRVWMPN